MTSIKLRTKHRTGSLIILLGSVLLFAQISFVVINFSPSHYTSPPAFPEDIRAAEPHAKIELYDEYYLEIFPDKTGSGTQTDPFIIENFEIDGGGTTSCIY
ncbi:MAG: hypothetical protein KAR20_06650, partial [Candidatus Heimdallarchaeota archaeon]|nr:hypothetical protein [Candidatus Heimdallarchaeota archaeon]